MSIKTLWKRAWRFVCWSLVALGYVIAWPFWKAWKAWKRLRRNEDEQ